MSHVSQVQTASGHTNTGASVSLPQQGPAPQKKGVVNLIGVLGFAVAIAVGAAFAVYGDRLLGTAPPQPASTGPIQTSTIPGNTQPGTNPNQGVVPNGGLVPVTNPAGGVVPNGIVGGGVAPANGTVQLAVTVQPMGALVFLDGNLMQITPQGMQVPRDARPHKLRAQATGFATKELDLTLDRDQSIDIILTKGTAGGSGGRRTGGGKPPSGGHDSTPDLGY